MKRLGFNYKKKTTGEEKNYNVIVTSSGNGYFSGIDLNKLTPEEVEEVKRIQSEYEEKIKPFVDKAYRIFIKENITEFTEQELI